MAFLAVISLVIISNDYNDGFESYANVLIFLVLPPAYLIMVLVSQVVSTKIEYSCSRMTFKYTLWFQLITTISGFYVSMQWFSILGASVGGPRALELFVTYVFYLAIPILIVEAAFHIFNIIHVIKNKKIRVALLGALSSVCVFLIIHNMDLDNALGGLHMIWVSTPLFIFACLLLVRGLVIKINNLRKPVKENSN